MPTKLTRLEIEIILDRPDECIVECSCQFYTDEMITEVWEDVERQVYPEQKVWDSCDKIRWSLEDHKILPEELDEIDKMVLDDCLSGSTMDRAEDVSPQYHGKVRATAIRLIDKLEKLGVKFSWADRWY